MPRKVHPRSFAFTLSRRTLGEHRVHRLHDRHAFVQRHQGTLEEPFAEAAGDLVGLMPETPAFVGRFEASSLSRPGDEGERGRCIEVAVHLGAGIRTDDGRSSRALGRSVQVKTACAPLGYPNNIEVCPSTPVKAGSTRTSIRSGLPSTIDAKETG